MRPQRNARSSPRRHARVEPLETRTLLAATAEGAASVAEGSVYTLSLPQTVGGQIPTGWNVQWGDSTGSLIPAGGTTANHTYGDGPATMRVTVNATVNGQPRPVPTRIPSGGASH